jgi:3D (Asp-Asp-Asp) domain-containing protein
MQEIEQKIDLVFGGQKNNFIVFNNKKHKTVSDKKKIEDVETVKDVNKLSVCATAYSSHRKQTDNTPFLAAWNNKIRPNMKIIAVSRDLISKYGLGNGTKVKIKGLSGYYTVRDKMNKKHKKSIDIYMGLDHRKALCWGRQRTVIYW